MRILYINHYAGSRHHGMEFRPFYLAREWVRAGNEVLILAGSRSHVRVRQPELVGSTLDEQIDGVRYRWYATPPYDGNGAKRVLNMFAFLSAITRDGRRLAAEFRPDVVIASSTYPMDIWPARRIARRAKATLVFEVHDLWPLTPVQLGGMSRWHPFIVLVQLAEDYAYRHADKVVSLLPKALDYMKTRGLDESKFVYVSNGIDEQDWASIEPLPAAASAQLERIRASGQLVVGYAGHHGLANALDTLLDAAQRLQGRAQIVMVGAGPERDRLAARVAREQLSNVTMLPPLPRPTVPSFLAAIDVAFLGMLPHPLYQYGISHNKLMDYMMAGKPIVMAADVGDDPIAMTGCGVTVPPGDAAALATALERLSEQSPARRAALGAAGKEFVLRNRTYRVLSERFLRQIAQ